MLGCAAAVRPSMSQGPTRSMLGMTRTAWQVISDYDASG